MKSGKALKTWSITLMVIGGILAAAGLIGIVMISKGRDAMIIERGIRSVTTLSTTATVIACAGGVLFAGGIIPLVVKAIKTHSDARQMESTKQEDQKQFSEYAKDSLNPQKTRMRFEQLRRNNPSLSDLVDRCLRQMDSIDTYQARHKSLLDANEAVYLEDTIEVIDNSEKRMCRNFRNVINCCILVEDTDRGEEALDKDIIESSLKDNEDELSSVSTLLKYSVAYINNYNRNGVSDRSELDAWLKVMKKSMEDQEDEA